MDRQILNFTANEQTLIVENPIRISTNKVNYIEAHFSLGANWSGYDSVRAVWFNDYQTISTVLDSQGVCRVPFEVMKRKGQVKVDLVGSISENDVLTDRLTSYPVVAVVVDCVAPITGAETSPITPSQFEQFVANVRADADRAEQSAEDAESSAESASASASAATQSASDAQTYAQNAENSAIDAESAKDDAIDAKEDAESARDEIRSMRAEATTLSPGSDATASYSNGVLSLGIPQGIQGEKGDKGDTGATPNLSIGTVETLPPTGSSEVTIAGTAENPVLNFKLVKGDTGEVTQAELDSAISDLKSDFNSLQTDNSIDVHTLMGYGYYHCGITPVGDKQSSSERKCVKLPCVKGDKFIVSAKSNETIRLWCFVDASNNILSCSFNTVADNDSLTVPRTIYAPDDTAYVIFNANASQINYIRKIGQYDVVTEALNNLYAPINLVDFNSGNGFYIATNIAVGSTVSLTVIKGTGEVTKNIVCITDECKYGERYIINADASPYAPRLYAFIDSNNKMLLQSGNTVEGNSHYGNPVTVQVPQNAVKAIFHCNVANSGSYIIKHDASIPNRVASLESEVDTLQMANPNGYELVDNFLGWFASNPYYVFDRHFDEGGIYYYLTNSEFRVITANDNSAPITIDNPELKVFRNIMDDTYYRFYNGGFYPYGVSSPIVSFEKTSMRDVSEDLAGVTWDGTIMQQIYDKFDELVEDYPSLITKTDACTMANMSYPAYADYYTYIYKISNGYTQSGFAKQKIFLVAGTHGQEIASQYNTYIFAKHLLKDCVSDRNMFSILTAFDVYILPCCNGWATEHLSRNNYNSININRNFPTIPWMVTSAGDDYSGTVAGSEFETQLVMALFDIIKPIIFIDHHNYGNLQRQIYLEGFNMVSESIIQNSFSEIANELKREYPQYFGASYGLLSDALPHMDYLIKAPSKIGQMAKYFDHQKGCMLSITLEVSNQINFVNGEYTTDTVDAYGDDTMSIADYTLQTVFIKLCEMAIDNMGYFIK